MCLAAEPAFPLARLAALAVRAGERIMAIRATGVVDTARKEDDSPVTRADREAEGIVLDGLAALMDEMTLRRVPIVAEEAVAAGRVPEIGEGPFVLVDALDGTREFVRGGDDFTVNIAFIEGGAPVAGIVHQPATGDVFAAARGAGWSRRAGVEAPLRRSRPKGAPRMACRAT